MPPERRDRPASQDERLGRGRRSLGIVLVAVVAVLAFGFWNLHLRASADAYFATAEEQAAILRDLAVGVLIDDPTLGPVDARVGVAGPRVILIIADGGPLGSDERLIAWLEPLGSSPMEAIVLSVGPRSATEVAARFERGAATGLVVTRERGLLSSSGPRGVEVLRVRLPSRTPGT